MSQSEYMFRSPTFYFKHKLSREPRDAYFPHSHNLFEILYFLNGDATHVIEDKKYKLKRGDLVLIRPSSYHFIQINSPAEYERYDILFDETALGIRISDFISDDTDVINIQANPIARSIFEKLDYYLENFSQEDFSVLLQLLLKELFYDLRVTEKQTVPVFSVVSPILSRALRYINEHLFTLDSVASVAEAVFVTEGYLHKLFREELKNSPKKYITDKRLLAAQRLLAIGEKPTKVYENCGFRDYSTFYRSYVNFFGYSPSQEQHVR